MAHASWGTRLAALALCATLGACTCDSLVATKRFACQSQSECSEGYLCRGGECRPSGAGGGSGNSCFPGEDPPRVCANAACQQTCEDDGGYGECLPTSGPGLASNPLHCGECGRSCSQDPGLTCIDARCTCGTDSDCPASLLCAAGGLCVPADDACAAVRCPAGQVCRGGACGAETCDQGCRPGEVCEADGGFCRPIHPCRFPIDCGDGGVCEGPSKADGLACNDGVACSHSDVCLAGECVGTPYSCPAPTACQQAVACAGDGGCTVTPMPDGTGCDDGVACTHSDQCTGGACAGTAYTCTPGLCAATSVCGGDGGCVTTPRNNGASCDDAVACTHTDVCTAGSCAGTAYTCPAPSQCQQAIACGGDGGCVVTNKLNGTACDAGLACSTNDVCTNGACAGTPVTTYFDGDGDGRGNSAQSQSVCPTDGGWSTTGGDCDDTNSFVYQTATGQVRDQDHDAFSTGSAASPCVGVSATFNGRSYARDSAGQYTWLSVGFSQGTDCDDTDAGVGAAPTWYRDVDGDGYGSGAGTTQCSPPDAGYVPNGTDCLDSAAAGSNLVYRLVTALYDDTDRDGYADGTVTPATQCVGAQNSGGGRIYYRATTGSYTWTQTSGGTDCLDTDADVFQNVSNLVVDTDNDGYPPSATEATRCVGATQGVGGRTYYVGTSGTPDYMTPNQCINRQGNNCGAPFDCYDSNSNARPGQLSYFSTQRGDNSFDYDCSGTIVANTSGTYCASTVASVQFWTDAACTTGQASATECVTPTAFALPGACGKALQGTAGYTNPGVCTTAFRASATVVGCH